MAPGELLSASHTIPGFTRGHPLAGLGPERQRHHRCHIASEAVHPQAGPVFEHGQHLVPEAAVTMEGSPGYSFTEPSRTPFTKYFCRNG